jgi:hypothetical protein
MIYIFGDSWGFSYRQAIIPQPTDRDGQVFDGADLASLLGQELNEPVFNLCERGDTNIGIIKKMTACSRILKPNDIVIVLQTDPLRLQFLPWYLNNNIINDPIQSENPFTLMDLCIHQLLNRFYQQLHAFAVTFNIQLILHGGISVLDKSIAKKHKLLYTEKSSTEIICNGFVDNFFVESEYVAKNDVYLKDTYTNYVSADIAQIIKSVKNKNKVWYANTDYFTHNHTTQTGSTLVAKYLSDYIQQARTENILRKTPRTFHYD